MVRATFRYGKGGAQGNVPRTGMRGTSGGAIQGQYRIDWDDHELRVALDKLGLNGDAILKQSLIKRVEEAIQETKTKLKRMAGALAGVRVPPPPRASQNIYTKVADHLTYDTIAGTSFIRVYAAEELRMARYGVRGSRGGEIAKIVAGSMKPFSYSPFLPPMVRSSTAWFSKTGRGFDFAIGLRKNKTHPGFKRTYDFMLNVENNVVLNFEKDKELINRNLARFAGLGYGRV